MKYFPATIFLSAICLCCVSPGKLKKLSKAGISYQAEDTTINLFDTEEKKLTVQYTGCGGLRISKDGYSVLIDPFFSNQKLMRLSASLLGGHVIFQDYHFTRVNEVIACVETGAVEIHRRLFIEFRENRRNIH